MNLHIDMKLDAMYDKLYLQGILLDGIAEKFDNSVVLKWGEIENSSLENAMNKIGKQFGIGKDYVVCGTWCFDRLGIDRLLEIYHECVKHGWPVLLSLETMVMVISNGKNKFETIVKNAPEKMVEHSDANLIDIEESSNGMTFKYSNKTTFKPYEERPETVYDLINTERNKTNGK